MKSPIHLVEPKQQRLPIILTSPHSGSFYPGEFLTSAQLPISDLRKLEDCFVDELWNFAPDYGAPILSVNYARAYVDVNRSAWELDADMFCGATPLPQLLESAKAKAGLGSIPQIVAQNQNIYGGKIDFAEASRRIHAVHRPFHAALAAMIQSTFTKFGGCLLLDCHSMPHIAAPIDRYSGQSAEIVLGNRFGQSCRPETIDIIERSLRDLGFRIARNDPYPGGYITEHHSNIDSGIEAVQIEIDRALYMNENDFTANHLFSATKSRLQKAFSRIANCYHAAQYAKEIKLIAAE